MVLGRRKAYAKTVVKKMVTAKKKPAQQEAQITEHTYLGAAKRPPGGILLSLGFFLGRLPFGGAYFLITFFAYVLRRPKTIILPFSGILGFEHSRGHGLCK